VIFSGLALMSAPGRVMIPRRATERLAAAAVARVGGRRARVAHVGTGSGAIAVAVASACPHAAVWATDTSFPALALARANVRRHGLEARVFVRHGDLLDSVPGLLDVVVANLPYIPASTETQHPDLRGEPFAAVFAPGDGLGAYRRLVDAATTRLAADGVLLLQLDGRLVAATRRELPTLRASLDGGDTAWMTSGARVERDLQAAA
jgi:release factor glutamine methyltransferase